jgi:hypothetical protein
MTIGILMAMWCVSGIVMMYVAYPDLPESRRVAALPPLNAGHCCALPATVLPDDRTVASFQIEMLAKRPVLRVASEFGPPRLVDLNTGTTIERVSETEGAVVAEAYGQRTNPVVTCLVPTEAPMPPSCLHTPLQATVDDVDQWTLSGVPPSTRPLFRFARDDDPDGTEVYVSSVTGKAVQVTTRRQRFWNWLGPIPHWLYVVQLRRHPAVWSNLVIYASAIGVFLTLAGIYLGVNAFVRNPGRRWSPFRGWLQWHHVTGLIFGVFVLTWVASGLLSMNPWGLLESEGAGAERQVLQGEAIKGSQVRSTLAALQGLLGTGEILSLRSAPLQGRLYVIATTALGGRIRFDARGVASPLSPVEIDAEGHSLVELATENGNASDPHHSIPEEAPARGASGAWPATPASAATTRVPSPELITQEDDYYFTHHSQIAQLPAYRLVLGDTDHTRYYFDAVTGQLVRKVDAPARGYRWLHEGLHRLDFTATLRSRPIWDAVMLVLMAGVTLSTVAGTWLGIRRMRPRR